MFIVESNEVLYGTVMRISFFLSFFLQLHPLIVHLHDTRTRVRKLASSALRRKPSVFPPSSEVWNLINCRPTFLYIHASRNLLGWCLLLLRQSCLCKIYVDSRHLYTFVASAQNLRYVLNLDTKLMLKTRGEYISVE